MAEDWLSLVDAAKRLGVSPRTARRWVKEGRLPAELRPGPYGQTYYVPASAADTFHQVTDVVQVSRPVEVATLAQVIDEGFRRRDTELEQTLSSLRAEVARLADEVQALRAGAEASAASEPARRRWWWPF